MVTLKLSEKTNAIATFDEAIFEVVGFYRVHVAQIESIQANTDKKGQHEILVESPTCNHARFFTPVDENAFAKVVQLVATIRQAKADFRFD